MSDLEENPAEPSLDPVFARLAALEVPTPGGALTTRIRARSLEALCPRRLHPAWVALVLGSSATYLGGAAYFVARLF